MHPHCSYKAAIAASANVSLGAVVVFNATASRRRLLSGLSVFTRVTFSPSYYSTAADNYRALIQSSPSQVNKIAWNWLECCSSQACDVQMPGHACKKLECSE